MNDLSQTLSALHLLGDATRVRLLALLEGHELTVAELCRITDLPQSRVSTHLGKLRVEGWVRDRREGASTHYTLADRLREDRKHLWSTVAGQLDDEIISRDRRRRQGVLSARNTQTWAESVAGEMERHYSPGRTWEATAQGVIGLLELGDVLDVGSGDGAMARLLAPRARQWTCLDQSPRLLDAARRRLGEGKGLRFVQADMHDLPFEEASFDTVLMFNVLSFSERPADALRAARRVLRSGGRLALVTLASHEHRAVAAGYDHVNLGFEADEMRALLVAAGLRVELCDTTSRERRKPHFSVLTAFARRDRDTDDD